MIPFPKTEEVQEWLQHPGAAHVRRVLERQLSTSTRTLLLVGLKSADAEVVRAAKDVEGLESLLVRLKGQMDAPSDT